MPILERLTGPADLRGLSDEELDQLAAEIRETIIRTVAVTGGHLGSSLGVVEITLALHRLLESPRDKIVWDTGHQAYAHKLLTGRLERFHTLRQMDGVGGFPRRSESDHDVMDGGHAGTGLSIAEGLATSRDIRHSMERIAVVVGDAALMSGLSLEALNDIGHRQTQLMIVLNDNEMSISPAVGAISKYLSEIKLSSAWRQGRTAYDTVTERIPVVGSRAVELSRRVRQSVVSLAQAGQLFEDLGITYIGVMPGHDRAFLEETFRRALTLNEPVLVHVRTQKGKGYRPAERDQVSFHGAALPPIDLPTDMHDRITPAVQHNGDAMASSAAGGASVASTRDADAGAPPSASVMADRRGYPHGSPLEKGGTRSGTPEAAAEAKKTPNYTAFFATELLDLGANDRRIVGITDGMPTGTGLHRFQAAYPERLVPFQVRQGIRQMQGESQQDAERVGQQHARLEPARSRPGELGQRGQRQAIGEPAPAGAFEPQIIGQTTGQSGGVRHQGRRTERGGTKQAAPRQRRRGQGGGMGADGPARHRLPGFGGGIQCAVEYIIGAADGELRGQQRGPHEDHTQGGPCAGAREQGT